ncbi:uncharacterized protein PFL1_02081 [Pseudozyma flocculosa PF-1]|uniref:Signal peptidase complex subunit 2 n=1 Tax=Pseudozyma flocculosa TaxID=84751 RepID=A0A5C3F1P5_9BASI|nr:uncharacterized protein PFL1_02081 [Pseudozyma flocculosa PF-1]EPQ30556.1 hypothetical protein PFL1_02081 [Pseudozyma flocculosa PF-1]SPO37647.1 uncharacterized protein PSFLO_03123 [Pseudozyma flocculosa]
MPALTKQASGSSTAADQASKPERIYVNNADLGELKLTCDEAVERILTRDHSSSSTTTTTSSGASNDGSAAPADFPAFKASHFHTDLRLALGYTAAVVMIGTTLWAYFIEKEWENNKRACGFAVAVYAVLSAVQAVDSYLQGNTIFVGKRRMLSKRIETENLKIVSPALGRSQETEYLSREGKPVLAPPNYSLKIDYTRKSNGGKSLLGSKKDTFVLGHLGEWFTEDGEFIESIFEERLISGLQKAFGQ